MKLAIKAELAYSFAPSTQVIANIEASHSCDQTILSESLDIQPQVQVLSDATPHGDRSIRAAFSGNVTILYQAVVENNLRQLLPTFLYPGRARVGRGEDARGAHEGVLQRCRVPL